jgi:hypothetical protein
MFVQILQLMRPSPDECSYSKLKRNCPVTRRIHPSENISQVEARHGS